MEEFIKNFMTSPYFNKYVINKTDLENVIGIYIAGSSCLGVEDEYSDYDVVVLTAKPLNDKKFFERYVRLKYKGRPAHWYYNDISCLFNVSCADEMKILCSVQLSKWFRRTTIYENPKYLDLILKLDTIKTSISTFACYAFLETNKTLINKLISQNCILEEDHTKIIYHYCFASSYLTGYPISADCLKELKRIRWSPVKQEYKDYAIEILKKGMNFINTNTIDCKKELNNLYDNLYK